MNWLGKVLSSSGGKKFAMGVTGLLLCGFLAAHLAGNLLMYVDQTGETYNSYADALHKQVWLVKTAEAGLVILFVSHVCLAITTTRENRAARGTSYEVKVTKIDGQHVEKLAKADTWMFISGAIVLAFLVLHLCDFTLELRPDIDYDKEPFDKAMTLLKSPVTYCVYLIGCLVLGLHLSHGCSSAFQSLGLSHPKYDPFIKWAGVAFAIVIGVGFASFPFLIGLLP